MEQKNIVFSVSAILNKVRVSSRKMKLIINLIRYEEIYHALSILSNISKQKKSLILKKLLLSLLSNWKNKYGNINSSNDFILYIKEIRVNQGKTIKRIRPVPQGKGHRIRKRSSSIFVILEGKKKNNLYGTKIKSNS